MTSYRPLVEEVAATAGDLLEALHFGSLAVGDYSYPGPDGHEMKQRRLEDLHRAERAVRACANAVRDRRRETR